MSTPRYAIGIDLGTTHCALSYVDVTASDGEQAAQQVLPIPQLSGPGAVEARPLLPSFLYLPHESELAPGDLALPWATGQDFATGEFARTRGAATPIRLVASAKSWLCHPGVDRRAAILPAEAPPDDTPEAVQLALGELDAEAERLADALADVRLALARDDEKLARSAGLRADIDTQAGKTRVWAQLGELIGSADGKKFRNFAQQLTLDVLLGYANRHLESLSRRYRLERLKDSLGLLVVDQDMGGEVRSVHSLSGGESFLVSLALALALASLSSHRVRVESLFIDEGFGTLDGETLDYALKTLASLRSGGRLVGIISHVPELKERIDARLAVHKTDRGSTSSFEFA